MKASTFFGIALGAVAAVPIYTYVKDGRTPQGLEMLGVVGFGAAGTIVGTVGVALMKNNKLTFPQSVGVGIAGLFVSMAAAKVKRSIEMAKFDSENPVATPEEREAYEQASAERALENFNPNSILPPIN